MRTPLAPSDLGTILSVWAHPDDETYLAGGLMAAAVAAGQRVVCVSATAGEHGTDDPHRWPPHVLGPIRRAEAVAAMTTLGVTDHRFLDYEDGSLAALDPDEPVRRIGDLLDDVRPDTIVTFGPDGITFHPDHQAVASWVEAAWRLDGCRSRLLQAAWSHAHLVRWADVYERWAIYMTDERPTGVPDDELAVRFELPPEVLDRKLAALASMPSQTAEVAAMMGEDYRENNAGETFVEVASPGRRPGPDLAASGVAAE